MRSAVAIALSVLLWTSTGCAPGETGPRDAEEQFQLGDAHQFGRGVERSRAQAVVWYRKAADQGHATAQVRLATSYAEGRGVKKNPAEALRLYRLAADQGQPKAQLELGLAYRDGRGVAKDPVQAQAWLMLSGNFGNRVAIFMSKQLTTQMTEKQLDRARGIAHEWRATYYSTRADEAANPRGG